MAGAPAREVGDETTRIDLIKLLSFIVTLYSLSLRLRPHGTIELCYVLSWVKKVVHQVSDGTL